MFSKPRMSKNDVGDGPLQNQELDVFGVKPADPHMEERSGVMNQSPPSWGTSDTADLELSGVE